MSAEGRLLEKAVAAARRPRARRGAGTPADARAAAAVRGAASEHDWTREAVVFVAAAFAILLLAGWLYLSAYYDFFQIPSEGLGISLPEVFTAGTHSLFFALIAVPGAVYIRYFARLSLRGELAALIAVAGGLAALAAVVRWYSTTDIALQTAGVLWVGFTVLGLREPGGLHAWGLGQRALVTGSAVLLVLSLPTALGNLDAQRRAAAPDSHLEVLSTHDIGLPGGGPAGGLVRYRGYVLVRESSNQFWLLRTGRVRQVYSVPKNEVVIRY